MDRHEAKAFERLAEAIERQTDFIKRVLDSENTLLKAWRQDMSKLLDEFNVMKEDIARQTTVSNSLAVFVKNLDDHLAELEARPADEITPEDMSALRAKINENTDAIAAAMVKRTDAAAEPERPMEPVSEDLPPAEPAPEVPVEPAPVDAAPETPVEG